MDLQTTHRTELQDWIGFSELNPIQKARKIADAGRSGLSNRKIAGISGVGETTIRNLLSLLTLSAADQQEIESGAPYRPFLAKIRKIKKQNLKHLGERKARAFADAAECGARVLKQFFVLQQIIPPDVERILGDVSALIHRAEDEGELQPSEIPWSGDPETALAITKPADFDDTSDIERMNSYIAWLSCEVIRLMPNSNVREAALASCLSEFTRA
jgi:hypothetical protein